MVFGFELQNQSYTAYGPGSTKLLGCHPKTCHTANLRLELHPRTRAKTSKPHKRLQQNIKSANPSTLDPQPSTLNPQPSTLSPYRSPDSAPKPRLKAGGHRCK